MDKPQRRTDWEYMIEVKKQFLQPFILDKVLVLGGTGMLGSKFMQTLKHIDNVNAISLARKNADFNCDISDKKQFYEVLKKIEPTTIINCAAIVDLDNCEQNPLNSWSVNVEPLFVLHEWLKGRKSKLVHISTDHYYDYGGDYPHKEEDPVVFKNIYAKHKFIAEKIALETENSLVLRTSIIGTTLYSGSKTGFWEWSKNVVFLDKKVTLFNDVFTSSIDIATFCKATINLIVKNISGVVNLASSETYSKRDFVLTLAKKMGRKLTAASEGSVVLLPVNRANCLGLDVSMAQKKLEVPLPSMVNVIDKLLAEDRLNKDE